MPSGHSPNPAFHAIYLDEVRDVLRASDDKPASPADRVAVPKDWLDEARRETDRLIAQYDYLMVPPMRTEYAPLPRYADAVRKHLPLMEANPVEPDRFAFWLGGGEDHGLSALYADEAKRIASRVAVRIGGEPTPAAPPKASDESTPAGRAERTIDDLLHGRHGPKTIDRIADAVNVARSHGAVGRIAGR